MQPATQKVSARRCNFDLIILREGNEFRIGERSVASTGFSQRKRIVTPAIFDPLTLPRGNPQNRLIF